MTGPMRDDESAAHRVFRRIYHGAEGGLVAGLAFILADMGWSRLHGQLATIPIHGVATVFNVSDHIERTPDDLAIGIFTHAWLSALFGIVFALLLPLAGGWLRSRVRGELRTLFAAGTLYGLALYLFNYQVLGHLVFTWFTGPHRPDFVISVLVHVIYGVVLAPFFIGLVPEERSALSPRLARGKRVRLGSG
jgi:hypothetical protein